MISPALNFGVADRTAHTGILRRPAHLVGFWYAGNRGPPRPRPERKSPISTLYIFGTFADGFLAGTGSRRGGGTLYGGARARPGRDPWMRGLWKIPWNPARYDFEIATTKLTTTNHTNVGLFGYRVVSACISTTAFFSGAACTIV